MKIVLCSPVPIKTSNQSGIQIRIQGLAEYLKKNGHTVKIIDRYNESIIKQHEYVYSLISTKQDSFTYKVIEDITQNGLKLITDLYTPILLEKDLSYSPLNPLSYLNRRSQIGVIRKTLAAATFFIVANRRQKKYWLKTSKSLHQPIKPASISTIPTGYPPRTNLVRQPESVIAWFGGIYPWLDPTPLAKAFANLAPNFPTWRLRIIGGYHPSTGYQAIFNKFTEILKNIPKDQVEIIPWQKPNALATYLKDVSFAVHLPKKTQEDVYSHRIRLLTLTESQIPVLTSGRDLISNIIISSRSGMKISTNSDILAQQLTNVIKNPKLISQMMKNAKNVENIYLEKELKDSIFRLRNV